MLSDLFSLSLYFCNIILLINNTFNLRCAFLVSRLNILGQETVVVKLKLQILYNGKMNFITCMESYCALALLGLF